MLPYQYSPITAEEHGFRLLRLHPATTPHIEIDIIHASLKEAKIRLYEAVSYVWGSSQLVSSVYVQGSYLNVTNNLELVLRDLRYPHDERWLWIDGICINQNDQHDHEKKEKNHQVKQMARIYSKATRVLVHLGRPTSLTPVLRDTLVELEELEVLSDLQGDELTESDARTVWQRVSRILGESYVDFQYRIRQAVEEVLGHPWFTRIWVVQEIAYAREARVYWGTEGLSVPWFVALVQILDIKRNGHQDALLNMMPRRYRRTSPFGSSQDLLHLLQSFKGAQASNSHDRIFALLNMCEHGKGQGSIVQDYSRPLQSVVRESIAYMCFCDKDDVPPELERMDRLMDGIDFLLNDLLVHFARHSRLKSLRSLLSNRMDETIISFEILESAFKHIVNKEVIDILLDHHPDASAIIPEVIQIAIKHGADKEIIIHLFDYAPNTAFITPEIIETAAMEEVHEDVFRLLFDHLSDTIALPEKTNKGAAETPLGTASTDAVIDNLSDTSSVQDETHKSADETPLGTEVDDALFNHRFDSAFATPEIKESEINSGISQDVIGISLDHQPSTGVISDWAKASAQALSQQRHDVAELVASQCAEKFPRLAKWIRAEIDMAKIGGYGNRRWLAPLWLALLHGDVDDVQQLLKGGADVNGRGYQGLTPLQWAAADGKVDVVNVLLSHDADINARTTRTSIRAGELAEKYEVRIISDCGGSIETLDFSKKTALALAAQFGREQVVQVLLDCHADIEARDFLGRTPLGLAVERGRRNVVQILLDHGANVEARDRFGRTPLSMAASGGFDRVLSLGNSKRGQDIVKHHMEGQFRKMMRHRIDMELLNIESDPRSSLITPIDQVYSDLVILLLKHGANASAADQLGRTPLWWAVNRGHQCAVERLLDTGVNENHTHVGGMSLLSWSIWNNFPSITLQLMESNSSDIFSINDALQWAVRADSTSLLRALLEKRAVIDAPLGLGQSLILMTVAEDNAAAKQVLLDHPAIFASSY
ncbi:hypothetical protein PFICI_05597 [Pestalotiopsis fici W106-1]|uniref:Heterokaryon incompatibility domain-containing protein n=1 Tax=Pestalotiopsis fici (strain W106-1 / CGMCC3.15140) TaxID=1229662 RepID=W3XEX5_PESFW|nr:uncharacterized protein PFICI_05597 [Pestalotiopsis fici W106-1]ETS83721.1 hypothetical protein PFICI_05597 [Pestalotiopsis fici W106-1]